MGFDKQCILDIQSVAKDYFCPVCHTLVYPDEALQLQCTHLFCKPCLTHLLNNRRACPHDRYLVTAADSKPLVESNKILAETIGTVAVCCLYYMSGCKWKGRLSECKIHYPGCPFGDYSPVTCNRCRTDMVHRQVEKHAQLYCPGVPPPALQMQPHFSQQQMGPMHPLHSHVPMQQQQYVILTQGQCPYVTPAPLHVHQHAHPQQQPIHLYPGMCPPHQQSLTQQSSDRQSLHPQSFPGQAPGLVQNTQQSTHFILQQTIHARVYPVRQMQNRVYAQSSHVVSVSDIYQLQPNYGTSQMQAQLHLRPPQPNQLPPLNSHPSERWIFHCR